MTIKKFTPNINGILVKQISDEDNDDSNFNITSMSEIFYIGEVIEPSEMYILNNKDITDDVLPKIPPGKRIAFKREAGGEIVINGDSLRIININDVLGFIE